MKKLVALLLCLMMVVPATLASAETAEGKVLNIWCWNDEFQRRFNAYLSLIHISAPTSPY